MLCGSAVTEDTVFVRDENFGWGKQGPNVNLQWSVSAKASYYYTEVLIKNGQDIKNTYFMATGFNNGYCGLQGTST